MADKVKSKKEHRSAHSPHPFQNRIKPITLPPMEDPVVPHEGAVAQPPSQQPNVPGNQGARTTGFGMSEAIVSTGAVGGSVTNVDVHPHGEVKQAMAEKKLSKDNKEVPGASTHSDIAVQEAGRRVGAFIRSVSSRVRGYVSRIKHRHRSFPDPIPEPLPATEFSSDSGTHTSLASGPLNLPDINYSVTDSEETSDQTSDRPVVNPVQSSPEEEENDPRTASVPEAVHPKPEDPGRRAKSAAAVLQTAAVLHTSHDSDNSDNEGDQDGTERCHDDGSSPVSAVLLSGVAVLPKSPVPHRESEVGLESHVSVLPEGAELPIPQDRGQSTSEQFLKPKRDPSPSEKFLKPQPDPDASASDVYLLRTISPVEIRVSQNVSRVHTCISFETTPPTSDEEYDSGKSDGDEE